MVQTLAQSDVLMQPEYSIYIYHHPENQHEGHNDWEMRSTTFDLNAALDEAEALFGSQGYRKVEVKQRLFDPKSDVVRDFTLKVFGQEKEKISPEAWIASASVLFCALSLVWFLTTVFHTPIP